MFSKYDKQDSRVQWIRIIACIIVIGCHVRLHPITAEYIDKSILLIHGIFDDGVAVFFVMMGFFLFNNENFPKLIKKVFKTIFIPALVLRILSEFFQGYIGNQVALQECLTNSKVDWYKLLFEILSFDLSSGPYCAHLWYVNYYILIVLMFPMLKCLCSNTEFAKKAQLWVISLGFMNLVLQDVQKVFFLDVPNVNIPTVVSVSAMMCVSGYVLWENRSKVENNRVVHILSLIVFVLVNLLRYVLQYRLLQININDLHYTGWCTSVGYIAALSLICFFLSMEKRTNRVVNYIGSRTFVIYLVHMLVYAYLGSHGHYLFLHNAFVNKGIVGELLYNILFALLVFVISLFFAVILNLMKELLIKINRRKFNNG